MDSGVVFSFLLLGFSLALSSSSSSALSFFSFSLSRALYACLSSCVVCLCMYIWRHCGRSLGPSRRGSGFPGTPPARVRTPPTRRKYLYSTAMQQACSTHRERDTSRERKEERKRHPQFQEVTAFLLLSCVDALFFFFSSSSSLSPRKNTRLSTRDRGAWTASQTPWSPREKETKSSTKRGSSSTRPTYK